MITTSQAAWKKVWERISERDNGLNSDELLWQNVVEIPCGYLVEFGADYEGYLQRNRHGIPHEQFNEQLQTARSVGKVQERYIVNRWTGELVDAMWIGGSFPTVGAFIHWYETTLSEEQRIEMMKRGTPPYQESVDIYPPILELGDIPTWADVQPVHLTIQAKRHFLEPLLRFPDRIRLILLPLGIPTATTNLLSCDIAANQLNLRLDFIRERVIQSGGYLGGCLCPFLLTIDDAHGAIEAYPQHTVFREKTFTLFKQFKESSTRLVESLPVDREQKDMWIPLFAEWQRFWIVVEGKVEELA
jgi:hypothetical protein